MATARRKPNRVYSESGLDDEPKEESDSSSEERFYLREQWNEAFEDDIEDLLGEEAEPDITRSTGDLITVDENPQQSNVPNPHDVDTTSLITVLNIVVTATLTSSPVGEKRVPASIDLLEVVLRGARLGFQMNKRRFSAAMLSCIKPSCCVLIFELGVIVCAGCKNFDEATGAIEKVVGYLRGIRPSYANLRAVDLRIRNMVGRVCVPCNIDVERLLKENPHIVIKGMIDTCVKLSPPPLPAHVIAAEEAAAEAESLAAPSSRNRRRKKRRAGSTLVCWSGYLLIIGGKSSAEMVRSFNYAYNIVKRYFTGSVEETFSLDKVRRYYTGLKTAFEMCENAPKSFIAVRNDGTEGTADEWRTSTKVIEAVAHYKQVTDNPMTAEQRRLVMEYVTPKMIEDERKQNALVVATKGSGALVAQPQSGALINRTGNDILQLIQASNDVRKGVLKTQAAKERVAHVAKQMQLKAFVEEQCDGSAIRAVKKLKPTKVAPLAFDQAVRLDQGVSSTRKWSGF